jgi:hypothetical protein
MRNNRRSGLRDIQAKTARRLGKHEQMDVIMSESVRWKEYRVRQEIYKERLKQTEISSPEVDSNDAEPESVNQISISFFEQMLGTRWDERVQLRSNT